MLIDAPAAEKLSRKGGRYALSARAGQKMLNQRETVMIVADTSICPDEHCVFLIKTGGIMPLCPFRNCLRPKSEKSNEAKEEVVK